MQIISAQPTGTARPSAGYSTEITSGAVNAVREIAPLSPGSTTVDLSKEAIGRYANESEQPSDRRSGNAPARKAAKPPDAFSTQENNDTIADTMDRLKEMLEKAQKRLEEAQRQLTKAMAEMRGAKDESQKMTAMLKVQAAQAQVIQTQSEVLEICAQINELLEEQQKQS